MSEQLFQIKFTVRIGSLDYPVILDTLGEGDTYEEQRKDAARQIRGLVCNKYSRDRQDEDDLFLQAAKLFRVQFLNALDNGDITIVGSRVVE